MLKYMALALLLLSTPQPATTVRTVTSECVVERGGIEVLRYKCPFGPAQSGAVDALVDEVLKLRSHQAYLCSWPNVTLVPADDIAR